MRAETTHTGLTLAAYLALSRFAAPFAESHLRKRLSRGKEVPARWREKLAEPSVARPDGPLVWMHAVGLGEVLALRGLIAAMTEADPGLSVLVTSSARASGEVFARNAPARAIHQFLPLDTAPLVTRFLDHWRPDLAVWAEQDLWPRFVVETQRRGIPLAMINARMGGRAFASRKRARGMYGDLYRRFDLLAAQDEVTASHLCALAPGLTVAVTGSLKATAPTLADAPDRAALVGALAARDIWLVASSHAEDEAVALAVEAARPAASLLILAPREPSRLDAIRAACAGAGLPAAQRSNGEVPDGATRVWIADSFGEMGLWYRLARAALIGGSFGPVEGHNPWEAVRLGCPVLHGPKVANFAADYAALTQAEAVRPVTSAGEITAALSSPVLAAMAARASDLQAKADAGLGAIRDRLLALMPGAQ